MEFIYQHYLLWALAAFGNIMVAIAVHVFADQQAKKETARLGYQHDDAKFWATYQPIFKDNLDRFWPFYHTLIFFTIIFVVFFIISLFGHPSP